MSFDITTARAARAPIPKAKLTREQENFLADARSYLIFKAPFWAHFLYNEMELFPMQSGYVPSFAATDSYKIFVDVEKMMSLGMTIEEVAFVLAHEICHGFLDDLLLAVRWRADGHVIVGPGETLPYNHRLMNMAGDYRINAMLVDGGIGKMPRIGGLYDTSISAKGMESCVEIYKKLYQQCGGQGGSGQGGSGQGGSGQGGSGQDGDPAAGGQGHGGFDVHMDPSKAQADSVGSGKRVQAIAAAMEAHRTSARGNLPGALQLLIGELLEPKVAWQDHLKSTMQRAAGDPSYDWRYLDKRLLVRDTPMYFARQSHLGCGTIVIGADTSGSVVSLIREIASEIAGIMNDLNPARVIVLWCDADVQTVYDLEEPDDINDLAQELERNPPQGGGGTRFEPVFDWVRDNLDETPDMLVYITDTYGSFPSEEPEYPVIWGSIVPNPTVPWGDVVHIDI